MGLFLLGSGNRRLQVADIIERVKNSDDIDAVGNGLLDEILQNVVRIVAVAQGILAAEQHLQFGVGHQLTDSPQAIPGVLVQKADTGVKGGAAPNLSGIETNLVHFRQDRSHLIDGHTGCNQRLVGVTQHGLCDFYFISHNLAGTPFKVKLPSGNPENWGHLRKSAQLTQW